MRLADDLALLLVVSVRSDRRVVAEEVEQVRPAEHVLRVRLPGGVIVDLLLKFAHDGCSGPGRRLVGADNHSFYADGAVQRCDGQQRDDRRAVGVGDDSAGRSIEIVEHFAVDLGYDKRDVRLHAKRAGVVDDHRAVIDGSGRELPANLGGGAEERQVHPGQAPVGQCLDGKISRS